MAAVYVTAHFCTLRGLGPGFNLEELETRSLEEVRPPPASLGFHTLQPVARLLLPALQAA